ncbi:MAG: DUF1848 family protein [Magnetococcales bacterium]|nr:DUF1848 family protein [Magnetococcales bacterium]
MTGVGGSSIEPNNPTPERAIADFLDVRQGLPGSSVIQWRYDPIVLTDELNEAYHLTSDIFPYIKKPTSPSPYPTKKILIRGFYLILCIS